MGDNGIPLLSKKNLTDLRKKWWKVQ